MNHSTKAAQELVNNAVLLSDGTTQDEVLGQALAYLITAAAAVARDHKIGRTVFQQLAREAHDHINKRRTS